MKYHFTFKLLALLLAACALVVMLGSLGVIISIVQDGLYTYTPAEIMEISLGDRAYSLAHHVLERYTAIYLGGCNQNVLSYTGRDFTNRDLSGMYDVDPEGWDYRIEDLNGEVMHSSFPGKFSGDIATYTFAMSANYPVHVTGSQSTFVEAETNWIWRDYYTTETEEHFLYYYDSPVYNVTIRIRTDALRSYLGLSLDRLELLYAIRYWAIAVLGVGLLIFVLCAIYLCHAAGRSHRHGEVRLKGLTKLPLDLYGAAAGFVWATLFAFGIDLLDNILWADTLYPWGIAGGCGLLIAGALSLEIWLYGFIAQIKMKNGCWWRRSLIGWCLQKVWKGVKFCFRALNRLYKMLPLIWQWLLTAAAMVLVPAICLFFAVTSHYGFFILVFGLWTVFACLADVAMVCYGAYAFGTLMKGAKQMSEGDLNAQIPTRYLFGAFRNFAEELNRLADAAMKAAEGQMKSERMKTELITNVSHDIKTPLTSIINYVDLLEKPHTAEEGQQYLEVLSRQSQRLKKLIDDLMDMSKASSGTMHVNISTVDAAEAIYQALGEFSDKLDAVGLTPVFQQPEAPVLVRGDGRLTWRVMSNLLNNIVKYALPGTRVYLDLVHTESRVHINLKNISREALNVSAEELTERFVRGDASRNTEGSGLGLNIAKSLMELQGGDLQLVVDGDLFKVTLTFPAA